MGLVAWSMGKWLDNMDGDVTIRASTTSEDVPRKVAWVRHVFPVAVDCLRLIDISIIFVTGYACYSLLSISWPSWTVYQRYMLAAVVLTPFLFSNGTYEPDTLRNSTKIFHTVLVASAALFGTLLTIGFMAKILTPVSRAWAGSWVGLSTLGFIAVRVAVFRWLNSLEARGLIRERVAIIGAGPLSDRLVASFRKRGAGIEIVGIYDDRKTRMRSGVSRPVGSVADLVEFGKNHSLDRILVTLPVTADRRLLELRHNLMTLSVDVMVCPEFFESELPHCTVEEVHGLPMLLIMGRPLARRDLLMKEGVDLVLSSILLILLAPLLATIALAIRIDSPGPVLFRQKRHGFNNRLFDVLKFRTMRQHSCDPFATGQTARRDERITRVGAFLRKSSLDELPQLLNVVRGEMSLVGPRPHAIGMRTADRLSHEIVGEYAHRHRVKPGITGWAQVNGCRGAMSDPADLRRRIAYDFYYIDNWSPILDFKILLLTPFRVFANENAY